MCPFDSAGLVLVSPSLLSWLSRPIKFRRASPPHHGHLLRNFWMASMTMAGLKGLVMYPSTQTSCPRSISLRVFFAVSMITGMCLVDISLLIRRQTSKPSNSGSMIASNTRSGGSSARASRAACRRSLLSPRIPWRSTACFPARVGFFRAPRQEFFSWALYSSFYNLKHSLLTNPPLKPLYPGPDLKQKNFAGVFWGGAGGSYCPKNPLILV